MAAYWYSPRRYLFMMIFCYFGSPEHLITKYPSLVPLIPLLPLIPHISIPRALQCPMIPHPFPLSPQGAPGSHDPPPSTCTRQLKLQDALVPHDPLPPICAQQLNPQGALVPHDPPPPPIPDSLEHVGGHGLKQNHVRSPALRLGLFGLFFSPFSDPLSSFFSFRLFSLIPPPTYTRQLMMHGVPVSHDLPHTPIPGN